MKNYFEHKMRGKGPAAIVAMVIFGIIAISGLAILFGFILMWLWNWLMPELFGLPTLTFWKAVGLFILAKLLFGGFGNSGGKGGQKKHGDRKKCDSSTSKKKKDFSKWAHYDKFWEEEGDKAYAEYCKRLENQDGSEGSESTAESENSIETKNDKTEE